MARIEDFGAHLSGAAKERWRGYRDAMARARREAGDPLTAPPSPGDHSSGVSAVLSVPAGGGGVSGSRWNSTANVAGPSSSTGRRELL